MTITAASAKETGPVPCSVPVRPASSPPAAVRPSGVASRSRVGVVAALTVLDETKLPRAHRPISAARRFARPSDFRPSL